MKDNSEKQERWFIAPYFIVDDVVATANFYCDKLGFNYDRFWGEPPAFCMVRRGCVTIMLSQPEKTGLMRPNSMAEAHGGAWDAYIWIADVEALYTEYKAKGVTVARDICDQEYGCRDFDVLDCNGYRLCFGQDLQGDHE